ncbi:MAG: M24 family metallopeptidase [Lentisphaeria bacterium]|nr:M24 family metallopeptidase [Lentisphaeria bacterium]
MKIAKLIVGSSEKCSNLFYKTGIFVPDDFIYFETDEEKGAIFSSLEFDRAVNSIKKDVKVYRNEEFKAGNYILDILLALAATKKIDKFMVPSDFPIFLADKLRESGIALEGVEGIFCPEREFKSEFELLQIKEAMRVTELGMKRAYVVLAEANIGNDGFLYWNNELLTSEILKSEIDTTLLRNGAIPDHTIAASFLQSSQPHNEGTGAIYANKVLVIDIFPRLKNSGYYGDLTRTYVKGRASDIEKRAFNAVVESREVAKEFIYSGAIKESSYNAAKNTLEKHGFFTGVDEKGRNYGFFHSLGHGVGLDIHESPRLSKNLTDVLKGGEIVTVEPGVYYPDWGGVRMEDIVYVREQNCEVITQIGDEFEID